MSTANEPLGFSEPNFSWQQYLETRPRYPDSLYQLIFAHHESHCQHLEKWGLALDVGAGHGVIAEQLSRRFEEVAVSEPNIEYLEFSRQRLAQLPPGSDQNFSFFAKGAEDSFLPAGSVELIVMGMSIQWADTALSIAAAARHLRPGGTLAIIFYRRPFLTNCTAEAATMWDDIWDEAVGIMMQTGQMSDSVTVRAWRLEDGGLDGVALPSGLFRPGVRRLKINANSNASFMASPKFARPIKSAVVQSDITEQGENVNDWSIPDVDAAWLMKALHSYLAGVKLFSRSTESELTAKLGSALQASGGHATAVHSVSIILATRR